MDPRDSRQRYPSAPAVVLGAGVSALGVVRGLRHHGITTHVICPPGDIAGYSRGAQPTRLSANRGEGRTATLAAIADPGNGVLIPCDDEWLAAVARFVEEGGDGRFTSFTAGSTSVEILLDKGAFETVLDELGIPRPRTWDIRTAEDLAVIDDGDLASFFLKPRDSKRFHDDFGLKAFRIRDRQHAADQLGQAIARGHAMVVQEFIEGSPGDHIFLDGFVDRHRRVAAMYARCRLRMYPPRFGNSTDSVTIPLADAADAITSLERLFDRLHFRGLFDAEFVLDRRDGRHKLVEVNGRPWWQVQLAHAAGVDVVHMAYLDALGVDVVPCEHYRVGRRWVHTIPDLRSRAHRETPPVQTRQVESWWHATHAVFQASDPRPGLVELRRLVREELRRLRSGPLRGLLARGGQLRARGQRPAGS